MSAHTPGPWVAKWSRLEEESAQRLVIRGHGDTVNVIAATFPDRMVGSRRQTAELWANGEVMAAGPTMLDALERALRETGFDLHAPGCIDGPTDRPCCWVREVRLAIAAARGDK